MATQVTLGSGVVDSASGLKLRTNGTTEAVDISTGQVVTLAKDAVVNGLTVGRGAGSVSTNTAVGASALAANTTGAQNTAVGYQAGYSGQTAPANTFVGYRAGYSDVTGYNTAVGYNALDANTSGYNNTALAQDSLGSNTSGAFNTALGYAALAANTTASNNTAVGYQAGYTNQDGANNVFFGYKAGYSANTSGGHTLVGYNAGTNVNSSSSANTFFGNGAGDAVTSGAKNTIIGRYSGNNGGLDIRTSSNYIVLSDGDGNPRAFCNGSGYWVFGGSSNLSSAQNSIFYTPGTTYGLGFKPSTNSSSPKPCSFLESSGVEVGSITTTASATTYSTSSDYRLKNSVTPMTGALAKVASLKPVTYKWNIDNSDGEGFIAHELAEVCPHAVVGEKDAVNEDGTPKYQGIDTSFLVATLTAAIQELKAEFDAYKEAHP